MDYPSTWTWTASGPGGTGTHTETMTTTAAAAGDVVTYIHTDALGSPVARTDAAGALVSRTRYEPYGSTAGGVTPTIGFTGHVNDAATGLVYMQQRYYDPVAGRFLSIDPVTTDANTGGSFNRYAYANNSPYSYVDPDGRDTYRVNRDLRVFGSSARSIHNPISHTLVATTNASGNIVHTYSWGNDANLKGWNLDQPLDMKTASESIKNDLAERVGDQDLDPFIEKEFGKLNQKENEHPNLIVTDNCKTEATKLIEGAKKAKTPQKPPEPKKPDPLRPSERPGRE